MQMRSFKQIDVFGSKPLLGNPVAVVLDGQGISDAQMQQFARWMNLSETTFLLPPSHPSADYCVRIFTPVSELPFAGHPTLGSCHAWQEAGGVPKSAGLIVQECPAGLVKIRSTSDLLAFAAPPVLRDGPVDADTLARVSRGLRLPQSEFLHHQWVDNGPGWLAVMLRSAEQVLAIKPDYAELNGLAVGVVGNYPPGSDCDVEVRAFISLGAASGEDPVTGSLNASLAQWLIAAGLLPLRYVASQGIAMDRAGEVYLERDTSGQVWVGGSTVTYVDGQVQL